MGKQYYQSVCLKGHQKTDRYPYLEDPDEFCEKCGSKLISTCQNCSEHILGDKDVDGVVFIGSSTEDVPNFCRKCSKPYPWTELLIKNISDLIALEIDLTVEDKETIKCIIPDLIIDTPQTPVSSAKFKKYLDSSKQYVKDATYNLLVDVSSEVALKIMFP